MIYLAKELQLGGLIGPTKMTTHFSKGCSALNGFKGVSSLLEGLPIHWNTSQAMGYSL